jgi:hypothetical protein
MFHIMYGIDNDKVKYNTINSINIVEIFFDS